MGPKLGIKMPGRLGPSAQASQVRPLQKDVLYPCPRLSQGHPGTEVLGRARSWARQAPGAVGCVSLMQEGGRRCSDRQGPFSQAAWLGGLAKTPHLQSHGQSGIHLVPPQPPQSTQVPIPAPIVPKDPGTQGISAAGAGRGEGAEKSLSCVLHSRPERCTHGDKRLREGPRKCVAHTENGERKEEERHRREIETGREKRSERRGDRKEGEDSEKGREEEGVGRTFWASVLAAIRAAGGRWPGADNGAEECGTWD